MKLIVTVGVPASGKTTWAEKYCEKNNAVNVNRDDTRQELFGPFKWGEYKFEKKNEELVTKVNKDKALMSLRFGMDVVISDTNLVPGRREEWRNIAKELGAEYEERLFHISFDEAFARDKAREMSVGGKVLTTMFQNYHKNNRDLIIKHFKERLEYLWKHATQAVVLSDIDGTVAEMHKGVKGRRSPFEWFRVEEDTPRDTVIEILDYMSFDYKIIFMSGRDGICEEHTRRWLTEHMPFFWADLVMRKKGDSRPDWIIKLELLVELAEKGYQPKVMFDDRDQVVNTLREVGVEVFQVQPGNF
ncbi:PseT polynucleotide 5'-kinase and 3'-phosphatase [Vibrio phage nt-1]|uniref:PseT polynucleotide 5'-kinase and 3'-phosphatase n=1 Tax=Vibrio phage nt-1 TaxID=115992 RepID=R9TIE4_9CAUD|nr:polynucleotide kinase [Vibrio phage nt-1]AGN30140.1 PseT polynucleotide 5'-kinase and 3'-phosphatase [Vibrio phage nt-1]